MKADSCVAEVARYLLAVPGLSLGNSLQQLHEYPGLRNIILLGLENLVNEMSFELVWLTPELENHLWQDPKQFAYDLLSELLRRTTH